MVMFVFETCVCVYTSKYILPSHENMIRSLCVTLHEHMWDSSMLLFLSIIESLMTHDKNTCYFFINKFMICVWMCFSLQGLHHSTYLVSSVSSFHVIWLFARLFFLGYIVKWNDSWYDRAIRNRTISYSFYGRWTNLIINLQQKYCMLWYLSYYFIYFESFLFSYLSWFSCQLLGSLQRLFTIQRPPGPFSFTKASWGRLSWFSSEFNKTGKLEIGNFNDYVILTYKSSTTTSKFQIDRKGPNGSSILV